MKATFWRSMLAVCLLSMGTAESKEPAEIVKLGKAATALVEVSVREGGATGSGFCIDKTGLFITNAHVIELPDTSGTASIRLIINTGLSNQRILKAKVLRVDNARDLALLKVDPVAELVPLEFGKENSLTETMDVFTFGYPFGKFTAVAPDTFPEVSVNRSRVTSLKREKAQLKAVQFDGQINPGNSGGPVLDIEARVIGVAWATVRGAGINFAIPVGILNEFLESPSIQFDPPPLKYENRARTHSWNIKVQPPKPNDPLPDDLKVFVTVRLPDEDRAPLAAKPDGNGEFRVTLVPAPREPARMIRAQANFEGRLFTLDIKDVDLKVAGRKFMASDLRELNAGETPRVVTVRGEAVFGPIIGLPKVKHKVDGKTVTLDLSQATRITIQPLGQPEALKWVEVTVEAKSGDKVLATVRKRVDFPDAPGAGIVVNRRMEDFMKARPPINATPRIILPPVQASVDEGLLRMGGRLTAVDQPLQSAESIKPPTRPMGEISSMSASADPTEIRELRGHQNGIWDLAFSPSGTQILSASHDYSVRLWDAQTGAEIRRFDGHTDHVKEVAFLPDGSKAISVADDDTVRLWDLQTGRELKRFLGHTADVERVAVSPDGKTVFTASEDKTVRVWDIATGAELKKYAGYLPIAFTPDGQNLLFASLDKSIKLWDAKTDTLIRTLNSNRGEVSTLAVSKESKFVFMGYTSGVIEKWDLTTGQFLSNVGRHNGPVSRVVVHPDGRHLISVAMGQDKQFRVWDLTNSTEREEFRKDEINSWSLAISSDGRRVASADGAVIRTWELPQPIADAKAKPQAPKFAPLEIRLHGKIQDITSGGGGRYLFITSQQSNKLAVFDTNEAAIVKTILLPSTKALIAAGARKLIILFPDEKLIQRWDLATMERDKDVPSGSPINAWVQRISMGSDSAGPILASWISENSQHFKQIRFSFISLDTLKVLDVGPITTGGFQGIANISPSRGSFTLHPFLSEKSLFRASSGSGLFAFWTPDIGPTGFQTLKLGPNEMKAIYNHESMGFLTPGADGNTIFTLSSGRRDPNGQPIGRQQEQARTMNPIDFKLPSTDPTYFLSVTGPPPQVSPPPGQPKPQFKLSVCLSQDGSSLATFTIREGVPIQNPMAKGESFVTLDKRFHFVPQANLLVIIPESDDKLVLRKLDLGEILQKNRTEYLYVTTPSQLVVSAGKTLTHQIEAKSKHGGLTYELTVGPDEFKVSKAGLVTFTPLKAEKGDVFNAVITVADSSGSEVFHKLTVQVK